MNENSGNIDLRKEDPSPNKKTFFRKTTTIKARTETNSISMVKLDISESIQGHIKSKGSDFTSPIKIKGII